MVGGKNRAWLGGTCRVNLLARPTGNWWCGLCVLVHIGRVQEKKSHMIQEENPPPLFFFFLWPYTCVLRAQREDTSGWDLELGFFTSCHARLRQSGQRVWDRRSLSRIHKESAENTPNKSIPFIDYISSALYATSPLHFTNDGEITAL